MRLKRRLRGAIESAAARAGVLSRFERGARGALTILTYHRVLPPELCTRARFPSLTMPEPAFRAQVHWLSQSFEVMTISAGLERLASGRAAPRPLVAITFDDGYIDNATHAAPILAEFGVPATFFLVFDFVARGRELWFERLARTPGCTAERIERFKVMTTAERERALSELVAGSPPDAASEVDGPMSRDQVLGLIAAGHEVGSHTLTHPILTRSDDANLEAEVVASKSELERWLDQPVRGFCYPNGDNDERVRACARAAGYAWSCSTTSGRNRAPVDSFELRRIDVTPTRVTDHQGEYSELAFRSEISLLRDALRGSDAGGAP